VAIKLLSLTQNTTGTAASNGNGSGRAMNREFQTPFTVVLLVLLTAAAVVFAGLNFSKEHAFQIPYDGVVWDEVNGHLVAGRVETQGPGEQAGIKVGDVLTAVEHQETSGTPALMRQIYRKGVWAKATYSLLRGGIPLDTMVVLAPADRSANDWLRFIALIYLGIGMYILLRRWTAPGSLHFYIFCLVSFIYYAFKYTGKLNGFDWTVLGSNVVAGLLQPALFLHFALVFPETHSWVRQRRHWLWLIYLPGAILLTIQILALTTLAARANLIFDLDRVSMAYLAVYFLSAALVMRRTYRHAMQPVLRQQMKWLMRGTILAIAPFTLFYVFPYVIPALNNFVPAALMKWSVLSLVLLPLTFGYAIFRYRLMDVDLIFKRGVVYTLAAASIVGVYFGVVAGVAQLIQARIPSSGPTGLILAMIVTALLFDPVKNWIQQQLDQVFYRTRYDYRRTLVEFGRELSAEKDLDKMLGSVVDRLSHTLLVDRMGVFLASNEIPAQFQLTKSFGIAAAGTLDLSFLGRARPEDNAGHLFFENTHLLPRETPSSRDTIAKLDLNYYIPCVAQDRTIAVLGLGKTVDGDFLTSDDVALLETLAGYIGIAIQNARLYASLEQKVSEYERLKDFNESIVESISVGVLAVDLEDRIESWNSQMEVMYALPRWRAVGRPLSEVMPATFIEEFYQVRQNTGIHNLYKFRLDTPAGETRRVNVAIAPLVTRKFSVIGRLIIVDDITERVELESQLAQADKLSSIGLMAAGVAHEVNTPLAVISSYAQMLSKQVQGDDKKAALLEKITRQTFRASEIVNNLLNFSRTSGAEFGDVDVNRVVRDTLALLDHQFKTAHVEVEADLHENLPLIYGSTGRLQQVFLNLFLNAKDAMAGGGGTLRIATSNGNAVRITISDTGSGIAQEHISRIYDPFFTTKNAPREGQNRGTGLGLAVTYGILQEHAGKIRVESAVGEGTTFHLEFPLSRKALHV
jgi:two-component system NtrC family sensor kinase